MAKPGELTEKQKCFVREYIIDKNATQAAIRAGYSEKTAKAIGQENLTKPDVARAIQEQLDERARRTEITADYVLKKIKETADNAARDSDKLKGYELLGKYLKLFTEKTEVSGPDGAPVQCSVSLHVLPTAKN